MDLAGNYVIELVVSEGPRSSPVDSVTVSTVNVAPVADPGPDQAVETAQTVQLDASGSFDADGDALTYSWTLTAVPAGSAAALSDPTAVQPTFLTDVAGDYVAELTVNDGTTNSAAATVTASTDNVAPVAVAGPNQRAALGEQIELDGRRSSDADGDELSLDWSLIYRPPGSGAKITVPSADRPHVDVDLAGLYVVQLEADDGQGGIHVDTMVISTVNTPPEADAGPGESVTLNDTVVLDGAGSTDVDGDLLSFHWTLVARPAGSVAALSDPAAVRPDFTVDAVGTYVAQLLVDDGAETGPAGSVVISTDNAAPVAEAGANQTVAKNDLVQLDGSGSHDADSDPITYDWAIVLRPSGSSGDLSDPTIANPTFTPNRNGVYVIQLMVDDGTTTSRPDTATIITTNSRPTADAGPDQSQSLAAGQVQLDGSGSDDPDSDPLTYDWALIVTPAGSAAGLAGPTTVNPTFIPDVAGLYVAQLTVADGSLASDPDTVAIDIVNEPPVADAGPDQIVTAGATVNLDGGGSFDPDDDPLTYAWSFAGQPAGSLASLDDPTSQTPSFYADVQGVFTVELEVDDGNSTSAPDQMTVTATAPGTNLPPFLAAIGDQSVDLGASLNLTLQASDPNGDTLGFFATPLPLPDGASLDGATGAFGFTPGAGQVGLHVITFGVSDGLLTDTETITITVVGAPSFTDGKGNVTLYRTDRFGAVIERTEAAGDPLERVTTIERDADSKPTLRTDPNGRIPSINDQASARCSPTCSATVRA